MINKKYNSINELLNQAFLLKGSSLVDLYKEDSKRKYKGKGGFGNKVEELHYKIKNNSIPEPDVNNLKIEIKTNPLRQLLNKAFVPKESVVLGMIDFTKLVSENFESSSYINKNRNILFNMYLYIPGQKDYEFKFLLVDLIELSDADIAVIKKDWELIKNKVLRLEAHKLSQSDTQYLIALTKGQGKQKEQPYLNGKAKAKRRAFGYKASFVKHLISNYRFNSEKGYFELKTNINRYSLLRDKHKGNIEEAIFEKFNPFIGKTDVEIAKIFNQQNVFLQKKNKARWHYNTSLILTGEKKKYLSNHIEEFSKSGLTVKTIRVDNNLLPLEEVSFRTQDYKIDKQSVWEESSLYDEMSKKFLWVVYEKSDNDKYKLNKVVFWVMPKQDLFFLKEKWIEYKAKILSKDFNSSYFMNEDSFYYLKIKDKKGGANKKVGNSMLTSLSHWFRKSYVQDIISK